MKELYHSNGLFYIEKNRSCVDYHKDEKDIDTYRKGDFDNLKQFQFTKAWYSYLKQIPTLMEQYNILGKRIYGKMFYLTKECFEPSPTKLLINLIKHKCYAVVRFPEIVVKVYPKPTQRQDLSQLTTPVKDIYVQLKFTIRNSYAGPKLSIDQYLIGYQAGFDEKREYLQSHLQQQNGKFCLGASELGTLVSLMYSSDLIEDNNLDVFEIILDYLDIMLRCQSNEGGPYRHIEKMYLSEGIDINIYFRQIIKSYFLHFPYKEWVIQPVEKYINKEEYKGICQGLVVTNIDKLFKQIDTFIPTKFKVSIEDTDLELKDRKIFGYNCLNFVPSIFRFNDKYIDPYWYTPTTGYYSTGEKRDLDFISNEFKEKFMNYLLERAAEYNTIQL